MKFARLAFPLIFLALTTQADAQTKCRPGTVVACTILGKPGTRTCLGEGEGFGPCQATPPPPVTEIIFGKYLVLTVVYAPPGTTAPPTTSGEPSFSTVNYESDSSTGSTITNSSSFKSDYKVSVNVECKVCVLGPSGGASFEYTKNNTQTNAININKKTSSIITDSGPVENGVDHNFDQIWVLLNPKFDVTINGTQITWALDPDQSAGLVQYLYAGQLNGSSQIPPGVLQDLQAVGITSADYQTILAADPLAQCVAPVAAQVQSQQVRLPSPLPVPPAPCLTPAPTAPRYVPTNQNLPYDPPLAANNPVPLQTYSLDNSTISTQTNSYEYDYAVGMTAGGGFDLSAVVNETLTIQGTWTWTEINTTAAQTGTEQKSSLIMGGPTFGYTGPVNMDVYFDTVYQTFAFVPNELSPDALHGAVSSSQGKPVAGQLVTAVAAGVTYRTYTNAKGEYHFSKPFAGPIDLQAGSATLHLAGLEAGKSVDLRLQ
jgi:hypothetical protein